MIKPLALLVFFIFSQLLVQADFSFPSFPDDELMITQVGTTIISNGLLILTGNSSNRAGAAYYGNSQESDPPNTYVLPGFQTVFSFTLDSFSTANPPADGIAFVIQTGGTFVIGTNSAGIGYGDYQNGNQGIPNSIAMEFDIFNDATMNDPNNNHFGIHTNYVNPNQANENFLINGTRNINIPTIAVSGVEHTVTITYIAGNTSLVVVYDGSTILSMNNFNLTDYINLVNGTAWVGFSASTSNGFYARQYINSWYWYNGNGTIDVAATIVYGPGLTTAIYQVPSQFYIQLVDVYDHNATTSGSSQGIPLPICDVSFASNNQSTNNCSVVDNQDGTYTATYTLYQLGDYNIYVSVNGSLVGTSPYPISVSGPPFAANCNATGTGLSSTTAGQNANFTITTYDQINNLVSTGGSSFLVWLTGPGSTVNGTVTDNGDGTYYVQYSLTVSGGWVLNVQLNNPTSKGNIEGSPFNVICTAGAANAAYSTAYGTGLNTALAGVSTTFFIQAKDVYGNNATTPFILWFISSNATFYTGPTQTNNSAGLYTIRYTINVTGFYSLNITGQGVSIVGNPFPLTVSPGNPYAPNCKLVGSLSNVVTNITTKLVVQAYDKFNNKISTSNSAVKFNCTFFGAANFVVPSTDTGAGTYTCSYFYTIAGAYTIAVNLVSGVPLNSTGPIAGSPFNQSATGPAFGPDSYANGIGLTSASAGLVSNFFVFARDSANQTVNNGAGVCTATLIGTSAATSSANVPVSCVYSSLNIYNGSYVATIAGPYELTILLNNLNVSNSPSYVNVSVGAISPVNITASGLGLSSATAGISSSFNIALRDQYGNFIPGSPGLTSNLSAILTKGGNSIIATIIYQPSSQMYLANYTLTNPTGSWNLAVTFNGIQIKGSPFTVSLAPGLISAATSYAYPDPIPQVNAYEPSSFNIQARDSYNNSLFTGGATFDTVFTLVGKSVTVNSVATYTGSNGIYLVPFTLNVTGNYSVSVTLGLSQISNSPLYVVVIPGVAQASKTTASGNGLSNAFAGIQSNFVITTRDAGNQPISVGGAIFAITMTKGNITVPVNTTDNKNGTYSCSYVAFVAGNYVLQINMTAPTIGPIVGSPFNPIVNAGVFCPQNATIYGEGLTNATVSVPANFSIQSTDCYGNPVNSSLVYYDVLIEGPDCTFGNTTYVGNGLTDVTYLVTLPGNYTITIKEDGKSVGNSPYPLVVGGEGPSSSNGTDIYLILMIIFIILYVITLILLIAYIIYDKRKKIKKQFKNKSYDMHD